MKLRAKTRIERDKKNGKQWIVVDEPVSYTHLDVYKRQRALEATFNTKPVLLLDDVLSELDSELSLIHICAKRLAP